MTTEHKAASAIIEVTSFCLLKNRGRNGEDKNNFNFQITSTDNFKNFTPREKAFQVADSHQAAQRGPDL